MIVLVELCSCSLDPRKYNSSQVMEICLENNPRSLPSKISKAFLGHVLSSQLQDLFPNY